MMISGSSTGYLTLKDKGQSHVRCELGYFLESSNGIAIQFQYLGCLIPHPNPGTRETEYLVLNEEFDPCLERGQ